MTQLFKKPCFWGVGRPPPGPRDILFFLHIPKTAGVTLTDVLDENFAEDEIFPSRDWRDSATTLAAMSASDLACVRCVRGHHWFGPGDGAIHDRISIAPRTITVLRDPVARTVSAYQHVMNWNDHWMRESLGLAADEKMPLQEFAERPQTQGEIANLQTRLIVGLQPGVPTLPAELRGNAISFTDEQLLEIATERIESFAWIGLTERMDESVRMLMTIMQWPAIEEVPTLNPNAIPSAKVELTDGEREAIAARTELDTELYARALVLFENSFERLFPEEAATVAG